MRVGVIGAGISGLVCAKRLLELAAPTNLQLTVTTLEWGRGAGGRTARRRIKIKPPPTSSPAAVSTEQDISFDHAAPYFSARTEIFRERLLKEWQAQGLAAEWITAAVNINVNGSDNDSSYWVGVPSNHAIARGIIETIQSIKGVNCLFGKHVQKAVYDETEKVWRVTVADRNDPDYQKDATAMTTTYLFDALVLSDKLLVLPNTYSILKESDWKGLALPPGIKSTAAVVLLVAFHKSVTIGADGTIMGVCESPKHSFLKTIIHESAKPGRDCNKNSPHHQLDLWVVHSTHEYAVSHLVGERLDDADSVRQELLDAFLTEIEAPSIDQKLLLAHSSVMAWDHAQPEDSDRLTVSHLLDAPRKAGLCGDFFYGTPAFQKTPSAITSSAARSDDCNQSLPSGVEAAALSGLALAENLAPLLV